MFRRFFSFTSKTPTPTPIVWLAWLCILIPLAMTVGAFRHTALKSSRDFADIYEGSRCLLTHCFPYSDADIQAQMDIQGDVPESRAWPHLLLYPPPTIALTTPLALLPFRVVQYLMFFLTISSLFAAGYLVFVRSPWLGEVPPLVRAIAFGLMLHAPKQMFALATANPELLCVAMLMICCFDIAPERTWQRAVLFSVATILKPHFALPIIVVLLLKRADGWRAVVRVALLVGNFTALSLLWFQIRFGTGVWLAGLRANHELIFATLLRPTERTSVQMTLLNLDYLSAYWIDSAKLRTVLVLALLAILGGGLTIALWRTRSYILGDKDAPTKLVLLTMACMSAMTLLPVYHAFYDGFLLMLVLPWCFVAISRKEDVVEAGVALLLVTASYFNWVRHLPVRIRGVEGVTAPRSLLGFVTHRSESLETLALSIVLVVALLLNSRTDAGRKSVPHLDRDESYPGLAASL